MMSTKTADFMLRLGIAAVFLYAGVAAFLEPSWTGVLPFGLFKIIPDPRMLKAFSVIELLLGIWLLWGRYLFYSALLSALILLGLMYNNIIIPDAIYPYASIFLCSLSLLFANFYKRR
jgi:hypothetical protein